jgi:hypothetical protein
MVGQGFSHFNARRVTKKIDLNFLLFHAVPRNAVRILRAAMVIFSQKGRILTEENIETEQIDCSWLDSVLDEDLKAIVEELEAGGKISAAEFSRLVELYREHFEGEEEETERLAEWKD